ncbi:MAG: hypothetical protein WDO14_09640 [Bacteroidota bacterium]
MKLTKEDLDAIGSLIDEKLDKKLEEKFAPFIETQKQVLKAQSEMNKRLDIMQSQILKIYSDLQEMI